MPYMIPLLIAILLLIGAICISRKFILIREWLIWACIVVDVYMKDGALAARSKILKQMGRKRFPIILGLLSNKVFMRRIGEIEKDIRSMKGSIYLYRMLIYGVNIYDRDYSVLLSFIENEGKKEKA